MLIPFLIILKISQRMPLNLIRDLVRALEGKQLSNGKLQPLLHQIDNLDIDLLYQTVGIISHNLTRKTPPLVKINSIDAACRLLQLGSYPILLLSEIYILPPLQKVIDFARTNKEVRQLMGFFEKEGYSSGLSHLQNMSFNFVSLCCQFLQLGATIKPLRVYQGQEYSDASLFKRQQQKLLKSGYQRQQSFSANSVSELRQKYLHSLSRTEEYQDFLLIFFVNILDVYLQSGKEPQHSKISFIETLKYGQTTITSEVIARLAQLFTYSDNFTIRTRALKLFDSLILWGDVEAILVANYTEHVQLVIKSIWSVEGSGSLQAGRGIYPQIEGQQEDKLQFYVAFLRCLQTWSQSFPNNQFLSKQPKNKQCQSAIFKLYRLLKDKKRFIFPSNIGIPQYQKQSHKNMHEKMIRNEMILADIESQEEGSKISQQMVQAMSLREVKVHFESNKERMMALLSQPEEGLYQAMKYLTDFRNNFQEYVEAIDAESQQDQAIDTLIQNGLELIDLINAIQLPYIEFLKQDYTFLQFREVITKICVEYYHPNHQKKLVRPVMSQRLQMRKEELKSLLKYQKSIPLWKELKQITQNVNIKELRSKYRQRMDKIQSSNRQSETSSALNLQINTKTMFSRQSREERLIKNNFIKSNDVSIEDMKKQIKQKDPTVSTKTSHSNQNKKNNQNKKLMVVSREFKKQIASSRTQSLKQSKSSSVLNNSNSNKEFQNFPVQVKERTVRMNGPREFFSVPFEQNRNYFRDFDSEQYKFSYVYSHIIIFKQKYLTVERVISQRIEGNRIKVLIQLILIPEQPLYRVRYDLENQQCIELEDRSMKIPQMMLPGHRYQVAIFGVMNKLPYKMPTVALFINNYPIFQYLLPFTINFFLKTSPYQYQAFQEFSLLIKQQYKVFGSAQFHLSRVLFPSEDLNNLLSFFPNSMKLISDKNQTFLWPIEHQNMPCFIIFEFDCQLKMMTVNLHASTNLNQSHNSLLSFITNCLAHLLAYQSK